MNQNSSKQLAVVVGATGAFGQVIVNKLLASGLEVIAVSRNLQALQRLQDGREEIILCVADIASDSSIDVIQKVANRPVRMVVHGPGIAAAGGVTGIATDAIVDAVNIKVAGLLRLVRGVDKQLIKQSRIIAIAGHYGLEPTEYASAAGVANAALINLVRQLSLAYGSRGITAHTIAPGPADTERLRKVVANKADNGGGSIADILEQLKEESSLGSFTTSEQVAWAVSTLLAPEADAMTGSTMMLDSGRRRGLP